MTSVRTFSIRDLLDSADPYAASSQWDFDAHRRAASQMMRKYKTYQSEIPLQASLRINGEEIIIHGRLDGIHRARNQIVIYEIKPVSGNPAQWRNHPAIISARRQLMLYADLARQAQSCSLRNSEIGGARLILVGERGRSAIEEVDVSRSQGLLAARVASYLSLLCARQRRCFPYDAILGFIHADADQDRPLQAAAWRELGNSEDDRLLLSMPPGSGKTRVAVRWALCSAGRKQLPVVWLTTKVRGRDEVLLELDRYRNAGIPLRILWKTSRERRCECARPHPDCPMSRETQDRLFWHGCAELTERDSWTDSDIHEYAQAHRLCSHELHRCLESLADVMIADLNYIIDPSSIKARRAILVLDEAQNVSLRVRERLQVAITRDNVNDAWRRLPPSVRRNFSLRNDQESGECMNHGQLTGKYQDFCEALRLYGVFTPEFSLLDRILRHGQEFPGNLAVAWCRSDPQPALVASLLQTDPYLATMLRPFTAWLALSGSLPADIGVRHILFPPARTCACVDVPTSVVPPVCIVPLLDFKHPLLKSDHNTAVKSLLQIRKKMSPTVIVFGQNRASNEVLSAMLQARGFTVMLDEDVDEDWSRAAFIRPDFLFVAPGGSLAEAVNPPAALLTGAVVLSPGFHPRDVFDELRRAYRVQNADEYCEDENDCRASFAHAVSRIIQAVGRVQRNPEDAKPVFLLNKDFADKHYMNAWPAHWYKNNPQEMLCVDINEALQKVAGYARAN
ncbi:hypothetical protein EHM69_01775 [candidate division KSB1 bacterium]|nr:MAG: hypothetical protein EHM69_01775 [candidate division KSB1 bacterium]